MTHVFGEFADHLSVTMLEGLNQDYRAQALKCLATLPPFSPVLNKLLATMSRENVSVREISTIMERDTVVAGNILKIANSAAYGRRVEVTSVCHAASMLGFERLRNAVFGLSVTRMWNHVRTPRGWSMARFNLHAVAVGLMADLFAQRTAVEYAEGAFLAGLFHDLGKLLIAVGLSSRFEEIDALCVASQVSRDECEREILGFTHADLSAEACTRWDLPQPIISAVLYHHENPAARAEVRHGTLPLSAIVRAADFYANSVGYSVDKTHPETGQSPEEFLAGVGLDRCLPELVKEFEAQFEPMSMFFR